MDIFYKIWTRKEAYIKTIGNGLFNNLKNFYTEPLNSNKYTVIQEDNRVLDVVGKDIEINTDYKLTCCYKSKYEKNIVINKLEL